MNWGCIFVPSFMIRACQARQAARTCRCASVRLAAGSRQRDALRSRLALGNALAPLHITRTVVESH